MGEINKKEAKMDLKAPKVALKKQTVRKRFCERATIYHTTAAICGVTERYVRMVMDGTRSNEEVEMTYITLLNGTNKLIEAVKKAVPLLPDERNPITYVDVKVWNEFIVDEDIEEFIRKCNQAPESASE